jgi:MFS family permease
VTDRGCPIPEPFSAAIGSILFLTLLPCTMLARLWALRGAVFLLGLMAGMNLPSKAATITALVSRQDLGKALAVQQTAPLLSLVLGFFLTVFLLNRIVLLRPC